MSSPEAIKQLLTSLERDIEEATDPVERRKLIYQWNLSMSKLLQLERAKAKQQQKKKEDEWVTDYLQKWDGTLVEVKRRKKKEE